MTNLTEGEISTLAAHIADRSDEELLEEATVRGIDLVLAHFFRTAESRYRPDRFSGTEETIQWTITCGPEDRDFAMSFDKERCVVVPGEAPDPVAILTMSLPDFTRFIAFGIDGVDAYMDGTLEIEGDITYAENIELWFDRT